MKNAKPLILVLILTGIVIAVLGLNIGLGGIRTLGWQGPTDFIIIADVESFWLQDSHVRFIGGVWFGVGAVFVLGGVWLKRFDVTLITFCGMIALAGLFRLSTQETSIVFSASIAPSLIAELLGAPLLGWWILRHGQSATLSPPAASLTI